MPKFINNINGMLSLVIYKNSIEQYIHALLVFLVLLVVLSFTKRFVVQHLGKVAARTASDIDDFIVDLIAAVGWPTFIVISLSVACSFVELPLWGQHAVHYALIIVLTIRGALLLQKILQYSINKIVRRQINVSSPSSEAMVRSVVWVVKWGIWILSAVFILDNLGINISALMAGIGIGGVAVALAAQAILGDAFSALCIYLDKPFEIGDFIIIDDHMGSVEHIGIKTTRIRSLTGEQLVFSNSDLTKSRIRNYKRMDLRRIDFKIGVVYQTPMVKLEKIPGMVREIVSSQKGVRLDRVHFQSFGDFALIYEIVYYVLSADYNVYMDVQQAINFEIMRKFDQEGIEFAYPTQTLFLKKEANG